MHADNTTLNDLSIFAHNEEHSVFHHLDFTITIGGREWLKHLLGKPLETLKEINETQQLLKRIISVQAQWPQTISNGTIMVIEKFYETPIENIPHKPTSINAFFYKLINAQDFSLVKYSVTHFSDFIKGLNDIVVLLSQEQNPMVLQTIIDHIGLLLRKPVLQSIIRHDKTKKFTDQEAQKYGYFIRHGFKSAALELIEIYSRLDAYYSMAMASEKYQFSFPHFVETGSPELTAAQLFHPLLHTPISYDITLEPQQNFLFLTGANMAGKSTFIKAVGVAVYLAHLGMGVPAQDMQLSLFDGLLSNIQVEDNIVKGESYFFNEVQRIHKTLIKISDGKKWLILIDELFKGTNVQDAMKCSTTVIEGLRKMNNALFILSTHLYEIGEGLKQYSNIQFRYFETEVKDDQLLFSYQLKEGISNDRLGYLILKKEGVVEMLQKL
ncbi:MAG: DNA mismatch repair protein MutS [Panacibacter sp.]